MAYTFRYLTVAEQADVKAKAKATAQPADVMPDEGMLRAWESDLAAHQALAASKTGEDRRPHDDAVKVLEAALTKAAPKP